MKLSKCFQLAIGNIVSNKSRSVLTMLGIIIGIMSVITLVSLMNGITNEVEGLFDEMGTTSITVSITNRGSSRKVTAEDMYEVAEENPDLIAGLSPSVTIAATVRSRNSSDSITTRVTGVSEVYAEMTKKVVGQGSFFNYVDVDRLQKVCVVGTYIQQYFFGQSSALGQTIKINGVPYIVVGVMEETDDSSKGSADECLYIPYTNASRINGDVNITSFNVYASDEDAVDRAVELIEEKLMDVLGDSDYFNVTSMKEIREKMAEITDMLTMALVFIAGISLLVGGIGIMNIMLVTVTERTKEIGIRKALGTRRRDIMSQFVIEAATLSAMGGIIGILMGIGMSQIVGKVASINASPTIGSIVLAFGISTAIGVIFGYIPARNAAALNPIDALRHD